MTPAKAGKILVLGATGQVGKALRDLLGAKGFAWDRSQLDLSAPRTLAKALTAFWLNENPSCVINAAAYTSVDQAEKEEPLARAINAESPGEIARWCAERNVPFVHYSTDYVFDGVGDRKWTETSRTGPLGAYGRTKLAGEYAVRDAGGRHLIFRTSWVYDSQGRNFLKTMLKLGADREVLKIVTDQHGAPTYAPHLARATLEALVRARQMPAFPTGLYHLCAGGETTWHGFASAIFEAARSKDLPLKVREVLAITTAEYPTPARRPLNSRLDTTKAERILGVSLPEWHSGLRECMEKLR